MALTVRRGATRAWIVCLEGCKSGDYLWKNFNNTRFRLKQGGVVIDKDIIPFQDEPTSGTVFLSDIDTLKLTAGMPAQVQIASFKETPGHSLVIKSDVSDVIVLPSLWDESVTDHRYQGGPITIVDPSYQNPIGHEVYETIHVRIDEYSGIVAENANVIEIVDVTIDGTMDGVQLVYNPDTETLFSTE